MRGDDDVTARDRVRLGRSRVGVGALGFGAATIGNLYQPVDDATARATLDAALNAGVDYFDTAPYYGFGLSERRLGDALRGRDGVVVSSKVGRLLDPDATVSGDAERCGFRSPMPFRPRFDYSHEGVMRSFEASLQRLGLARIDVLYVHDIGALTHGDEAALRWRELTCGGGLRALETLRGSGAIGAFGVGVNEVQACLDVMAETRVDALLLAGRYTLLEQGAMDVLLPACGRDGVSVVIGGPYNSGVLATGVRGPGPHRYDYAPAPAQVVAKVGRIQAVAERYGVALAAAALQFVLAHPAVASVIPGLARPDRVGETLALLATPIPADFWAELKAEGLIRQDAPTPDGPR